MINLRVSRGSQGAKDDQPSPPCSFCGKAQDVVAKLIVAPAAVICDECVEICVNLIDAPGALEASTVEAVTPGDAPDAIVVCSLCQLPAPAVASVQVPGRGCLCSACTDAIRAALGSE